MSGQIYNAVKVQKLDNLREDIDLPKIGIKKITIQTK